MDRFISIKRPTSHTHAHTKKMDIIQGSNDLCDKVVLFRKKEDSQVPYPQIFPFQPVRIENMAGNFKYAFRTRDLDLVTFKTKQLFSSTTSKQIFHMDGTLSIYKNFVHFKGCSGMDSLQRIQRDIGLESSACQVYMALMTGNVGCPVDVNFGCYIERFFLYNFQKCFFPRIRIIDLHPVIYLEMSQWAPSIFPDIPVEHRPSRMVVTVSHKGTVIFRLTWKRVPWNMAIEKSSISFCQWILDRIKECC